jgi:16S rRNA (guanine966-N2)-methyltransferase
MAKAKHTIRIISGSHRSRRLPVLDFQGLRPTGDRLREVLFNWLQMDIVGKNVLDLCAGSGALGFEAASRGAKNVILVEAHAQISHQLMKIKQDFQFESARIINQKAQQYLQSNEQVFDLVFLDPPFSDNLMEQLTALVIEHISLGGFLYRESGLDQELPKLPDNWQLYRKKKAGQVKIELWRKLNPNLEN